MADVTLALEITGKDLTSAEVTNVVRALQGLNASATSANFTPVTEGLRRSGEEAGKAGDRFKEFANKAVEGLREIAGHAAGVALGQLTAQLGTSMAEKFTEGATAMEKFGIQVLTTQQIAGGSVEEISRLLATMGRFGVSADLATGLITRFSRGLSGVELESGAGVAGTEKFNSAIARLGINVRNTDGSVKNTTEIMVELADAFSKMPISAERTTMMIDIFGRAMMAGGDATAGMTRFLAQNREQIEENFAAADKYRVTIQTGDVPAIQGLAEAHRNLHEALLGLEISYGRTILPLMTKIAEGGVAVAQVLNERTIPTLERFGTAIKESNLEGLANVMTFAAASIIPVGLAMRGVSFALAPWGGLFSVARASTLALAGAVVELGTRLAVLGPAGTISYIAADIRGLTVALGGAVAAAGVLITVVGVVAAVVGGAFLIWRHTTDEADRYRRALEALPAAERAAAQAEVERRLVNVPADPNTGIDVVAERRRLLEEILTEKGVPIPTGEEQAAPTIDKTSEAVARQAVQTDLLNGKLAPLLAQLERFKVVEGQIGTLASAISGALPIGIDQRDIDRLDIANRAEEQFIKQMNAASAIASVPSGALRTSIENQLAAIRAQHEAANRGQEDPGYSTEINKAGDERTSQLEAQLAILDQIEERLRAEEATTRNLSRVDHEIAVTQRQDLDLRDKTIGVEQDRMGYLSQEADLQDKINDLGAARTRILDDQAVAAARVNEVQAQGHVDNLSREQQILQLQARLDPNARAYAAARLREIALRDLPQAQLAQLQAQGPVAAATQQQSLDQVRNTVRTTGLELEVNLLQQQHRDMDIKLRKLGEEATAQQYVRDLAVNRFELEKRGYEDALYALQKYKDALPAPNDPDLVQHLGGAPPATQTINVPSTLPGAGRTGGVSISVVVDASGNVRSVNGATASLDYGRAGAAGATAFARAFNDVLATRDTPPVREHLGGNAGGAP